MPLRQAGVSWFQPLVVAAMGGCVALSVVDLAQMLIPHWKLGAYVVICCVLAALEAAYSYRLTKLRELRGTNLLRFRAMELAVMLIVVRAASFLGDPWPSVVTAVNGWPSHPTSALSAEVISVFLLVVLTWWSTTATAHDLERLTLPPEMRRGKLIQPGASRAVSSGVVSFC